MATEKQFERRARDLDAWIQAVSQLAVEVQSWAEERGWPVTSAPRQLTESKYGTYQVPELAIRTPSGIAYLEPVARDVAGAQGRVDLLAWPSLTRMMLIRNGDRWVLQTDAGLDWPDVWNRQTFEKVVNLINAAA